jgi:hypothetical protein
MNIESIKQVYLDSQNVEQDSIKLLEIINGTQLNFSSQQIELLKIKMKSFLPSQNKYTELNYGYLNSLLETNCDYRKLFSWMNDNILLEQNTRIQAAQGNQTLITDITNFYNSVIFTSDATNLIDEIISLQV